MFRDTAFFLCCHDLFENFVSKKKRRNRQFSEYPTHEPLSSASFTSITPLQVWWTTYPSDLSIAGPWTWSLLVQFTYSMDTIVRTFYFIFSTSWCEFQITAAWTFLSLASAVGILLGGCVEEKTVRGSNSTFRRCSSLNRFSIASIAKRYTETEYCEYQLKRTGANVPISCKFMCCCLPQHRTGRRSNVDVKRAWKAHRLLMCLGPARVYVVVDLLKHWCEWHL